MAIKRREKIFDAVVVASTGNVASSAIDVRDGTGDFSIQMVGGTGADLAVTYEASIDGSTYDTTTTSPSRTIMSSVTTATLVKGFDIPVSKQILIRVTGNAGNATNATVTGWFMQSE